MFSLKVYILVKYKKLILNKIFLEVQTQSLSRFTKKKSLPRKQKSNTGDVWGRRRSVESSMLPVAVLPYPSLPFPPNKKNSISFSSLYLSRNPNTVFNPPCLNEVSSFSHFLPFCLPNRNLRNAASQWRTPQHPQCTSSSTRFPIPSLSSTVSSFP